MKEGKIRFNTVFISDKIPNSAKLVELKTWSEKFQKNGLTPEVEGNYTGNLSFRSKEGFVITASALKDKENLTNDCFVYIKEYNQKINTFYVEGTQKPSSESIMHHRIYGINKEINAVFHGHNNILLKEANRLKLPITKKEYESGTIELATEVLNVLGDNKVIVLKNHGFVSVGKNMKETGEMILAILKRSNE